MTLSSTQLKRWSDAFTRCLPVSLANTWAKNNADLLFCIGDSSADLFLDTPGRPQTLETIQSDQLSSIRLTRLKTSRRNVHVLLPSGSLLRKRLELPLPVRENLRSILALEMDRLTPFSADQVYFDFRILSSGPHNQRLSLELAVVQRERVDDWLELLRRSGLVPRSIGIIDGGWPGLDLLPPQLRQAPSLKTPPQRYLWVDISRCIANCL
jgi:general secretion pathway protein L